MTDDALFGQVAELGRLMGWHDGSGRSRHQEYTSAYARRMRRKRVLSWDEALVKHADALNHALFAASVDGGELADLVVEQQRDDKPWIRRPRHILSFDEPAAVMALKRRAA